jgi:hypothetical protein
VRLKVLFGDSWAALKRILTEDIGVALERYWARVRAEEREGQLTSPAAEVTGA